MEIKMKIGFGIKLQELWLIILAFCGVFLGFHIGSSFQRAKVNVLKVANLSKDETETATCTPADFRAETIPEIFVATNPRGAERLPPGIVQPHSDFNLNPDDNPNYLLTITVGLEQKHIVNRIVSKFSESFAILLFHYDGSTTGWEKFEWSKRVIHVSARKQTKWWYAKRFLHPNIVAQYDYIFIWDEDLGVEHFNGDEYIKLIRKYGLEISQPGVVSKKGLTWLMTEKMEGGVEIHKSVNETYSGQCPNRHMPPCAGFVEIMAPVFSRESWRCVWSMIQNDLVHGWGLDFALWRCVDKPHEKMGVVDAQWIEHLVLPSLGTQGESIDGREPWEGVRERCFTEWKEFETRVEQAEKNQTQRSSQ